MFDQAVFRPFDESGAFRTVVHSDNVRQLATRGAGATLFAGGSGLAVQIVATVVLARLLTPKDFGLVTMVTTFSLLFVNFGLNGFTEAIIQRQHLNHTLASNLFWINLVGSLFLSFLFAGCGSVLAELYHDAAIAGVTRGLAVTIMLMAPQVVHLALLKRGMRFSVVSFNDLVARAVSVAISILLAWAGWGYWALVMAAIAVPGVTCIGAWTFCRWTPALPRRCGGTGSMVRFAVNTYARFTTGYFTNNLDNFLVGWKLGAMTLGFYKKAYDLFVLPSNQFSTGITIIAISALSRLQDNIVQYKKYVLAALGVMAFVGMGVSGDLTLVGRDLILVLLGHKWAESGRIFTIFAPGIGPMLLYCTHIWIHLSLGKPERWFRWGIVDLIITTGFLCTGLHWHATGIAIAWVTSYWVITLPALWYAGRPVGLRIREVVRAVWKYVAASIVASLAAFFIVRNSTHAGAVSTQSGTDAATRVVLVSLLFLVLYAGAVATLHLSFSPILQVLRLVREMIPQGRPNGTPSSSEIRTPAEITTKVSLQVEV